MAKVIIAGSRNIQDFNLVVEAINSSGIYIDEVVSGGAVGVDSLGEKYAKSNGIDLTVFYPNWIGRGRSAGHHRNRKMGDYADALIAVWDGESKGTKGMIEYMKKLGKQVFVLEKKYGE